MCPGPALISFGAQVKQAGLFIPYVVVGMATNEVENIESFF